MLHRNGTRLEIGTSDDIAELELVEARRLAETQRRQHQRVGVSLVGPRTAGSAGGSTVLSHGSIGTHTRTPGRSAVTRALGDSYARGVGERPSTATTMDARDSGRSPAGTMPTPGTAASVSGSWGASPGHATYPSPSAVRPSVHAMTASSSLSHSSGGLPARVSSPSGVGAYPVGHFPDISDILANSDDAASRLGSRGEAGLGFAAREGAVSSRLSRPYGRPSTDASPPNEEQETSPMSRMASSDTAAAAMVPPSFQATSPMELEARLGGGLSAGRHTPQDRHQWPPPPSAFMRTSGALAWGEERRQQQQQQQEEEEGGFDEFEPSPTRRSGLLPPP